MDMATESGVADVTARRLERWRQQKWIPRASGHSLGRGKGTTSAYTDAECRFIVEFARRMRASVSPLEAVLWTFLDAAAEVPEVQLRRAFTDFVVEARKVLSEAAPADNPEDRAGQIARLIHKGRGPNARNRRRQLRIAYGKLTEQGRIRSEVDITTLKESAASESAFISSLLLSSAMALESPHELADESITDLLDDLSTRAEFPGQPAEPDTEFIDAFRANLADYSLDHLQDTARDAPYHLLCTARDLFPGHNVTLPNATASRRRDVDEMLMPLLLARMGQILGGKVDTSELPAESPLALLLGDERPGQTPEIATDDESPDTSG